MGILGYVMIRFDYPRLTLVIALVLGETCERSYHLTMMISDNQMFAFMLGRPMAMVLMAANAITLCLPFIRKVLERRRAPDRRQLSP